MIENLKTELPTVEKLRKEQHALIAKAHKLYNFRDTKEWHSLTTAEKVLLDIQLSIMRAYIEILTDRIILIREKESKEVCNCSCECEENNKSKVIKITIEEGE